jgi:hypothetical protein
MTMHKTNEINKTCLDGGGVLLPLKPIRRLIAKTPSKQSMLVLKWLEFRNQENQPKLHFVIVIFSSFDKSIV